MMQAIITALATLAVIAPILALNVTLSERPEPLELAAVGVVVATVETTWVLVVYVVVCVAEWPALVVVNVLVTTSVVLTPAANHCASDIANGVFVPEQELCIKSYTCVKMLVPWLPMHSAEFMTKFPPLLHKQLLISETVSPLHPELSAVSARQICVVVG